MIPLVRLCAFSALLTASVPLTSQPGSMGCIQFVSDPDRIALVKKVLVTGDDASALVDLQRAGSGNLGEFLSKGGSLVAVNAQGHALGIANRDTLDSAALASDARILRMTATALDDVSSQAVPAHSSPQPNIKIGEVEMDWSLSTARPGLPKGFDLQTIKRNKINPNGLEIGDFDGAIAPAIAIGPFDGTPASPTPIGVPRPASAKDRAIAATVAIYFRDKSDPNRIEACNGVQVGPGLILTNLHCASRRHAGHVVHFGNLHVQPDSLLPGTPVSGNIRCPATVVSPDPGQGQRLDFALLRISGTVPAPYNSAIISLDDGTEFSAPGSSGQALDDLSATQVQYWMTGSTGGTSLQYQKYLMQPPNCAIKRAAGIAPQATYFCNSNGIDPSDGIDSRGVGHVCDSERGSSGSPLFNPAFSRLLALHRGGGQLFRAQNCAVPANNIRGELQAWGQL